MIKLSVSKDFSIAPGPRKIEQGKNSGEMFRKELLEPYYKKAKTDGVKLEVNLDGTFGYFDSFIEEAFGGLARQYTSDNILDTILLISNEEPELIDKIKKYVMDANKVCVR